MPNSPTPVRTPHLSSPSGNIGSVQKPAHKTTAAKNVAAIGPFQSIRSSCRTPARRQSFLCNSLSMDTGALGEDLKRSGVHRNGAAPRGASTSESDLGSLDLLSARKVLGRPGGLGGSGCEERLRAADFLRAPCAVGCTFALFLCARMPSSARFSLCPPFPPLRPTASRRTYT